MLFESGNSVSVDLSLFSAPRESNRPIDAYVVTEVSGTVTYCARRAAGAVFEVIRNDCPEIGPVVAGFDFAADYLVAGESGGLAFAVALAKRLLVRDPGPVAATGIVESSHNGGPVKAVLGIGAKLEAAGMVLPPGGWVVFPRENESEVPPELIQRLKLKKLKLCPVSSVAEAIAFLFPDTACKLLVTEKKKRKTRRPLLMIMLIFSLIAVSVGLVIWKDNLLVYERSLQRTGDLNQSQDDKDVHRELSNRLQAEQEVDMTTDRLDSEPGMGDNQTGRISPVMVNIFGKTRMNAEISKILADKLTQYFAFLNHHFEPIDKAVISGEVVVLRMEENWIEERQNYRSSINVALRNFIYEDRFRKIENENIQVEVYARGMVEDMLPLTAQALMNRIVNSYLSKEEKENEISQEQF